jgi:hypothetical protein
MMAQGAAPAAWHPPSHLYATASKASVSREAHAELPQTTFIYFRAVSSRRESQQPRIAAAAGRTKRRRGGE